MFDDRIVLGDIDLSTVGKENIRLAYLIESPYRFFIGDFLHLQITQSNRAYDVGIRNRITIREDEPVPNDYLVGGSGVPDELRTDFAVVGPVELSEVEARNLAKERGWESPDFFGIRAHDWAMLNVYRNVVVSLDRVVQRGDRFRTGVFPFISAPTASEFGDLIEGVVFVICPSEYTLDASDFIRLFELKESGRGSISVSIHQREDEARWQLAATPLPQERIRQLERALYLHERFVHYEFAHEAEARLRDHDFPAALIAAVVALESAHGAVVRRKLIEQLPMEIPPKKRENRVERLLREQGIYALLHLTPYLFLARERCPTNHQIDQCLKGFQKRNALMHAKVKDDLPSIRAYDSSTYRNAIHGVLKVYEAFAQELESMIRHGD